MMQFKTLPTQFQHVFIPFLVIFLACLAYIFDSSVSGLLNYQRDLVSNGELWRIFTGHFLHTNGYHLLLNIAAVALLWSLHGQFYTNKIYIKLLLLSAITCTVGIHYFSLDIYQYVGLSGILHGIFIWGALMDIKHKDKTGYVLLVGVVVKIIHEQVYGASADVAELISANVAVNAHLWGALGGLIFGVYSLSINKKIIFKINVKR